MSKIADAFQARLLTGLGSVSGNLPVAALADLILAPRASFHLTLDDGAETVSLDFGTPEVVLRGLASDCTRFCIAAFQSIDDLNSSSQNSLPWDLIKLYYSAFYSGHLVLRLLGTPCCFLDARHITKITEFADAIGQRIDFQFTPGTFKCEINAAATTLTFKKLKGRQSSTHDQFWKLFDSQLNLYAQEVLLSNLPAEDSQAVFASIEAFQTTLRQHGAETWLSVVRNEIQYRHGHGVWFPSSLKKSDRDRLIRRMAKLCHDPVGFTMAPAGDLEDFTSACSFVIGFAHSLLRRLIEISPPKKKFLAYATERFCVRT